MKKKKFITPKVRVIKLDAEELMQTPQSGGNPDGITIQSLTTAGGDNSILFGNNDNTSPTNPITGEGDGKEQ